MNEKHEIGCDWHLDQYPWECTCGKFNFGEPEIEQCDRDAASYFLGLYFDHETGVEAIQGKQDNDFLVKAFARHRIAAEQRGMERERERSEKDEEEAYEIGKRDGYSEAVQDIDMITGGDGEYRYCTDHDPERHTPDPETMKARIAERYAQAIRQGEQA